MHLPVARRRVPAAHSQDLQALHRLAEVLWGKKCYSIFFIPTKDTHASTVIAALIPKRLEKMLCLYLPVLVLWLERHQGAIFASRQDVLWGCTVNLLELIASFLTLTAICSCTRGGSMLPCHT